MNNLGKSATKDILEEECFVVFKPNSPEKLSGMMCHLVNNGYKPIGELIQLCFDEEKLTLFYPNIANLPFFKTEFVPYMTSAPCHIAIFKGFDIINDLLDFIGPETDPKKNAPHTLRNIFAEDKMRNGIHCPKTQEERQFQYELLIKWKVL